MNVSRIVLLKVHFTRLLALLPLSKFSELIIIDLFSFRSPLSVKLLKALAHDFFKPLCRWLCLDLSLNLDDLEQLLYWLLGRFV